MEQSWTEFLEAFKEALSSDVYSQKYDSFIQELLEWPKHKYIQTLKNAKEQHSVQYILDSFLNTALKNFKYTSEFYDAFETIITYIVREGAVFPFDKLFSVDPCVNLGTRKCDVRSIIIDILASNGLINDEKLEEYASNYGGWSNIPESLENIEPKYKNDKKFHRLYTIKQHSEYLTEL